MIIAASSKIPLIVVGCCIRMESSPQGPVIHHNETHTSLGVKELIIQADGDLQIVTQYAEAGVSSSVVAMSLAPDETMARLPVMARAGLSGTLGAMVARFSRWNGTGWFNCAANNPALYGPYNNWWLTAIGIEDDDRAQILADHPDWLLAPDPV